MARANNRFNKAISMWKLPYKQNNATKLAGLPAKLLPVELVYAAGGMRTINGKAVYVYELHYHTGIRWKRCIVAHATTGPATRNSLVIALPGSNSHGNGAYDLVDPPAGDTQARWPLQLCADHGVFAVILEHPKFGAFEYEPIDQHEQLMDAICGIQAARFFIEETPAFGDRKLGRAMFCGGWSWGAIESTFLAAAVPWITHAYIGSGQLSKHFDGRPMFSPPEWDEDVPDYDYADMMKAAPAKFRIQFGGNGDDYLYTPFRSPYSPSVDAIMSDLVAFEPQRFSTHVNPALGHQIDVADLLSWFPQFVSTAPWYVDKHPL